jgi:hypothetical protein
MKYTADQLLNILESYSRMIERDQGNYPAVVLDDIHHSIKSVLEEARKNVY